MLFSLLLLAGSALAGKVRPFPDPEDDISRLPVYTPNDAVPLLCNARQIDNGEHKFDSHGNVVYADFLKCQETAKPLALKYGHDEEIECTVKFEDERADRVPVPRRGRGVALRSGPKRQRALHDKRQPNSLRNGLVQLAQHNKGHHRRLCAAQIRRQMARQWKRGHRRLRNDLSPVPKTPQPAYHRHVLRRLACRRGRRGPRPRIQTDLQENPAQRPK
ncbi:hypothetical protein KL920_004293 [Ogataea angusta]|nr:hypothetical protein KL920_004293 [Ogataea angusta]KAG7845395.1 hypothetical protein KL941_003241 [Ogataea angusta]